MPSEEKFSIRDSDKSKKELIYELNDLRCQVDLSRELESKMVFYQFAIEKANSSIYWVGPDAGFIFVNDAACRELGYSREELLGMKVFDIDPNMSEKGWKDHWSSLKEQGSTTLEGFHLRKDGIEFPVEITANYLSFKGKEYNFAFVRNVQKRQEVLEALRETELRLFSQNEALENKNTALLEVLERIESEKAKLKENVKSNVEELLMPILEKMRARETDAPYVDILEKNLREIAESFGARISDKEKALTSREIEICNMVKAGLSSKEISKMLNIALHTVEKHRLNIRKKLGLTRHGQNLVSYLKSL